MDFLDNMVKSSNALIRERLNNIPTFGNKQTKQEQDGNSANEPLVQQDIDESKRPNEINPTSTTTAAGTSSKADNEQIRKESTTSTSDQSKSNLANDDQRGAKQQFAAIAADAEAVTQKAVSGAKNIGNFLFSMANKAGHTVSQTAKQVKQAVENTNILTDFTREQQEFIKEHGGNIQCGELPWTNDLLDDTKRSDMREQILSLSQDKRNFVKGPPSSDSSYEYDAGKCYPIALALLKEDPNLGKMRFELVPKMISEDTFWRNYFYRVSKLKNMIETCEDDEASSRRKDWASNRSSSGEGPDDDANLDSEVSQSHNLDDQSSASAAITTTTTLFDASQPESSAQSQAGFNFDTRSIGQNLISNQVASSNNEDSQQEYKAITEIDDDLKNKLKELNIGSFDELTGQDADWDEELQKDLQEFEVVTHDLTELDEEALDKDIKEMTNSSQKS